MNEYVVINNLDPTPVMHYTMDALPLHITLSNTFYSDADEAILLDKLKAIAGSTKAFSVRAASREQFGLESNVSVTEIEKSDAIQNLHLDIVEKLGTAITLKTPQFAGKNYRPHASDQPAATLDVGTRVTIDNLTLVKVVDPDVYVKAVFKLQQ